MAKGNADKRFTFADRHFKGVFQTFNASAAIWRAEQLVEEAENMRNIIHDNEDKHSLRAIEFPSYYIVGLVTCLEWHARSRLHDLLSYDPINFTADDIKQAAAGSNLEQLLRENVTVAQFVATTTLVSDFKRYFAIFDRIFSYIRIKEKFSRITKRIFEDSGSIFPELFERRHRLVHEIDHTQIGHWLLQDPISLEEVVNAGRRTIKLMMELEELIELHANQDFPNIFSGAKYVSAENRLISMISDIENNIIENFDPYDENHNISDDFRLLFELHGKYRSFELRVLESISYPGQRYYNAWEKITDRFLRDHLNHLVNLQKELREIGRLPDKPT